MPSAKQINDIKTAATLVGNLLEMIPETGAAKEITTEVFGVKMDPDLAKGLTHEIEWAGRIPVIGPALKALWQLAEGLSDRFKLDGITRSCARQSMRE